MKFSHELIKELPALAWLFELPRSGNGRLIHGRAIEIFNDGFLEGCIGESGDLTRVSNIFGSGLQIHGDSHFIITPSHTFESVYLYDHTEGHSVSNSLAFLLEHHRLKLPWDNRYGAKFASICLGIDAYEKELFHTPNGRILRIAYDNIELAPGKKYRLIRKPPPPHFGNYSEYIKYIENVLRHAFASATHPGRTATYLPLATCSTGYDSAAGAALATRLGCREAVTLRNARGGQVDSGLPVGERLGLVVREFDRPEAVQGSLEKVADFLATGMGGEDYCFRGFSPILDGRILLTGFHGGNIWGLQVITNVVVERGDVSGSSLQEFRLRHNFLHIPTPMIGALRHPDISAISRAAEMHPYRLHNDYDRPIPRRILEEKGVPRMLFGQQKRAASILLFFDRHLMGKVARRECDSMLSMGWVKSVSCGLHALSWNIRYWGYRALEKAGQYITVFQLALIGDWRIFEHSRPRASLEFVAAVAYVRRRYRAALQQLTSGQLGINGRKSLRQEHTTDHPER